MWSLQAIPLLFGAALALTSAEWRSQSIYQVVTDRFARSNGSTTAPCDWGSYCGGTWQGIINKLDYIQGMGFTAVWISPVVENIGTTPYGDPYHGYWGQNLYSLNPAFGTADDLKALSGALHARGMYLMVDVVANNMAYDGAPKNVNYSTINPFNSQSQYHPYCAIDWSNQTSIQQCWAGDQTVSLPDLRTEDPSIQNTFNAWISQLVSNYSIDGLRLDSAMSVNQNFWTTFVAASGVYAVGEVLDGDPTTMCAWQSYMPGTLNYATYYWIVRAFQSSSSTMSELANNIQWQNSTCKDITLLGNFVENHDNPRFPSITQDPALIINAIAFAILNDGIPIIYYGQEQGFNGTTDPYNREPLWPSNYNTGTSQYSYIKSLNAARHLAQAKDIDYASTKSSVVYSDTKTLATLKGSIKGAGLLSVFSDLGAIGASTTITIGSGSTGFAANTEFTDLLSCTVFTTDSTGDLVIIISSGLPRALFRTSALAGNDLCASSNLRTTASLGQTQSTTATSRLISSTASSTTSTKSLAAAATASSTTCNIAITFDANVPSWALTVKIVGSISQLGSWSPSQGLTLSTSGTARNGAVKVPSGTTFQYKLVSVGSDGYVTWEKDPDRNYTATTDCSKSTATIGATWQS
ncbi:glycoside hydrolase family 13 protein [Dothistroma septosporum NZE10]|uniref:alpha-amylase n=1 Tax=Dothistroma septosporum (strain NZE10 / CBS 128990) TaxID=675120 RepID=M2WK66_DOTSN|nr:glycoside hydrolase family 13 protein [Dothistroma septosporum NZE10]